MLLDKKRNFKIFFVTAAILLVAFLFVANFSPVLAAKDEKKDANQSQSFGLEETAGKAGLKKTEPAAFVGDIIGVVLSFVGVIFFGLMVYGGMIWLTARGNEQRVNKAKEIIISASIGLAIIFISYGVTNFIIGRFTQ